MRVAQKLPLISAAGIDNGLHIVGAAAAAELPLAAAVAMFEMESHGRMSWGNDVNGVFSGYKTVVTEESYRAFRHEVVVKGRVSNGVGASQITYAGGQSVGGGGRRTGGYFAEMEQLGLRPWDTYDNMYFGCLLLRRYRRSVVPTRSWEEVGTLYNAGNLANGVNDYGLDYAEKVTTWMHRFAG